VGDIVAVGVVTGATFALLLARLVGSVTHPVVNRKAATTRVNPKYRFILCTPLFVLLDGFIGQGVCRRTRFFAPFGFSLRLCVNLTPRHWFHAKAQRKIVRRQVMNAMQGPTALND
jgi:hypothetical protein